MDQPTFIASEGSSDVFRLAAESAPRCIEFLRDLVTIPSPSGGERLACERVLREMRELGYDDVHQDEMGNVLGRIGSGPRIVAVDAHVDTAGITNPSLWKFDPFRGVVSEGTLYGRGASDQKGGLAAAVHGVALVARAGLPADLTLWVTATVLGEDCDGLAWQYLVREKELQPEVVVVAMPSHLGVCRGQRGRMEVEITTSGEATHSSRPDHGRNAISSMAPVVLGLSRLHSQLDVNHPTLGRGSLAVTAISSRSPSLTAIPDECTVRLDRRLTIGEAPYEALLQIENLTEVQHARAEVRVLEYSRPSWRGLTYPVRKVFPAWDTPRDSATVRAAMATARRVLGREPRKHRSSFSSSGCATAGLFGIPTVGFGPGDEVHSHSVEDQISLAQLEPAMVFYALFPTVYLETGAAQPRE